MSIKSQFKDAIEKDVERGSASSIDAPTQGSSPIESCFKDAIEKKVPGTRSGGLLPERQMDDGFSYTKPSVKYPGQTTKIE